MASEYYGFNRGQDTLSPGGITVGTSTGSTDLELRIDLTKNLTRLDINALVEKILQYINDGRSAELKL